MYLIAGLGNPGPEYARTRHNIGFHVLDELARRWKIRSGRLFRGAKWGSESRPEGEVFLCWPQEYMNCSGYTIRAFVEGKKLGKAVLLVVCDDMDLPLGKLRIRIGGGSGGHKGLASLINAFGHGDFARIRIGIGRPPEGWDPADYVLTPFHTAEKDIIQQAVLRAADAVETIMDQGLEAAMNRFN
ncbi:MAG: aminoacyl-tRNA hydrolase [Armatimonadetes bacterium]|nr:aminoacyl-tRNA hydrolase [Armatimonadota bacterium]